MKQVVLRAHPVGPPHVQDFAVEDVATPEEAEGQVLLKTLWLSLDPMIRFALDDKPLTGPNRVRIGDVVFGGCVSQVVASKHPDFAAGQVVEGRSGWRQFAAVDPTTVQLRKIDPSAGPLSTALGVLGMPGQTAHACMIGVGRVAAGETVVLSAAAGAVGTIAGQIGKILGARIVGIAGGTKKCAALEALGFDASVDYQAPDYAQRLAAACPNGIDVYVENVGGNVTAAVLPLLKYRARMPVCGFISYYGMGMEGPGPDRLPGFMRTIMSKGLEVRGFGGAMVGGAAALADLAKWVGEGRIRYPETIVEGLDAAPAAFAGMFHGNQNIGKLLVRVANA
jgi:NADPH-dependent curcumin reductase CurA